MPMPLNDIETLIIIPTEMELDAFIKEYNKKGMRHESVNLGILKLDEFVETGTGVTLGGLGKVQFAVQTQYCINRIDELKRVLCVGASGGLKNGLNFGDVVVATETVEHDIRKHSRPMMPRFSSDESILKQFLTLAEKKRDFTIHFGPVASGDEDIMTESRKHELRTQTGAIAVAWEGAGAARACLFSNLPFAEIRGICDLADQNARDDFYVHLELVMSNLAKVTMDWIMNGNNG
jgi:adenosylhomocysteine nucleosidase